MKQNNGFIGIGLILAIVLGIAVVGGGAYYLGNNNSKKEIVNPVVNLEESLIDEDNNGLPDFATLPHEYGDNIKLLSFKVVDSNFVVETDYFNENASIKVFADPTGTGIGELDPMTTGAFLGTMTPDLNGENVKWTLSGDNFKGKMTNNLYATLYLNGEVSKSIKFPSEGAFVYESIFGEHSAKDDNLIKLTSCGVSLSKTSDWSVISSTSNEIVLDILSTDHTIGTSGINIKCVLSNTITDTDAKFGNITYFYDAGKKAWVEIDDKEGEGITPNNTPVLAVPLFTVNGLPVFRGTGRWLTYIVPISPSSILYLKEGDTEGGQTQSLTNLVKTLKKL